MIDAENLSKSFRVFDRRAGLGGAALDMFHRRYRNLEAVKQVSFNIAAGEMVGYIGANGAGKSTTIKMLMGILYPSGGTVRVAGLVPHRQRQAYLRQAGVVFGQRTQLWWDLAVQESFRLLQRIYDVPETAYRERLARFDEVLGVGAYLRTPVRKLSLGQRVRCELAAALLHHPRVLYLDEPTIGLDVEAKAAVREFLARINREFEVTVLLTTHDLKDIEALCPRVLMIERGELIYDGTLLQLRRRLGHEGRLRFRLGPGSGRLPPDVLPLQQTPGHQLTSALRLPGITWQWDEHNVLSATFNSDRVPRAKVIQVVLDRAAVEDISMEQPAIEEIVRRVYRTGRVDMGPDD